MIFNPLQKSNTFRRKLTSRESTENVKEVGPSIEEQESVSVKSLISEGKDFQQKLNQYQQQRRLTINLNSVTHQTNDIRQLFEDFSNFYASSAPIDYRPKWVIAANNSYKIAFDFLVMICLMFTCTVVPFRLAFTSYDPLGWIITYAMVDVTFLIDVILTFFTSYTQETPTGDVEVFDKGKIACNYLQSWFLFDVLSILPIDYIIVQSQSNFNSLFRFGRFAKIYKIVRLFRMAKVFRLLKKNQSLIHRVTEKMRVNHAMERLLTFCFFILIFIHVASCLFVVLAEIQPEST